MLFNTRILINSILIMVIWAGFLSTANSSVIYQGPGTSTITTSVDTNLHVVTYRFDGLQPLFNSFGDVLDFYVDTAFPTSGIETDPLKLSFVDEAIGQRLFRNGLAAPRRGYFIGTPEQAPSSGKILGTLALDGVDESFAKRDPYLFGIVYNDQYQFTGNYLTSTLQINSVDYTFGVPELITVPTPPSIWFLLSGLFILFTSRSKE